MKITFEAVFVVFVAAMSSYTHGLKCWTCNNARGDHDCMRRGKLVTCNENEQSCFTEIRNDKGYWRVRKRCKQPLACDNNKSQNLRAASINSQCNPFLRSSVCRCCCYKDQCNRRGLFCRESLNLKQCTKLPKLWNGRTTCTFKAKATEIGSVCRFTCDKGLQLIGAAVSTCRATTPSGRPTFDNPTPKCKKNQCFAREPLPNGDISCTDGNEIGSVCEYTCKSGYKMFGEPSVECEPSLKWSEQPPLCAIVVCRGQQAPFNGWMECSTKDSLVGTRCQFFCDEGSEVVGTQENICVDTGDRYGEWHLPTPVCQKMKCLPVSSIPLNGSVSCSESNLYDSVCSYACDRGFAMVGAPSRRCQLSEDGAGVSWSDQEPICERITCSPVGPGPAHGSVSCSDYNFLRSVCLFKCHSGLAIKGEIIRHCQLAEEEGADGVWSNPEPICETSACLPVSSDPVHGSVTCSDSNSVGSVCSYECSSEFVIYGNQTRECELDGNGNALWSDLEATCGRPTCDQVDSGPPDGSVTCTDVNFVGSVCFYNCNVEFTMEGNNVRTCQLDGDGDAVWSHHEPSCERISCTPSSSDPSTGSVSCSDSNFIGSVCSYECDREFAINGNKSRTCELGEDDEGVWSMSEPTCERITCVPASSDPMEGSVNCSDSTFVGSVCTYECNSEYAINGNQTRECRIVEDGVAEWNNAEPVCERIACVPASSEPSNGSVNCSDANYHGSVCLYTCDNGFEMKGNEIRDCQLDGNGLAVWSDIQPVCERIACDPVSSDPINGSVSCSDSSFLGSVCSYQCDEVFVISGNQSRKCELAEGGVATWSGPEPSCERATCLPISSDPSKGSVSCSDSNFIGSVCSYECNREFAINGNKSRTCELGEDGEGVWNIFEPTCERITCVPASSDPMEGSVNCSDSTFVGSVCTYECNSEYAINGNQTRECRVVEDGVAEWNNPEPVCKRMTCQPVDSDEVQDGSVFCSDSNFVGSICFYKCHSGFTISGDRGVDSGSRKCQAPEEAGVAAWNKPEPVCERITCLPPSSEPFGGVVNCSDFNNIGSRCTYECDDGFKMDGKQSRLCQLAEDGFAVWSSSEPVCERIACSSPSSDPSNGSVSCSDSHFLGSVCSYECNSEFVVNGNKNRKCELGEHGVTTWSDFEPICERITCPHINSDVANGSVSCSDSNNVQSICVYSCHRGYTINGDEIRSCEVDESAAASWSNLEPICERSTCRPASSDPLDGSVSCSDSNFVGSICSYECDNEFMINGNFSRTCQIAEDGGSVWNNPEPTCGRKKCQPNYELDMMSSNVAANCSSNDYIGSICTFSCDVGYFIEGSSDTECLMEDEKALWSQESPICLDVTCYPEIPIFENGQMECTNGNKFGSECTFICNEEFVMFGSNSTVCIHDYLGGPVGMWDEELPFCMLPPSGIAGSFNNSSDFPQTRMRNSTICFPEFDYIENGEAICTDGSNLESECIWICNEGFELIGYQETLCLYDDMMQEGHWTFDAPRCVEATCGKIDDFRHGEFYCSNGDDFMSVCNFTCDLNDGYRLYPTDIKEIECITDVDGVARWNPPRPCCSRPCPPYTYMDLVVVLDSSSSVQQHNWDIQKSFTRMLIELFHLGEYASRMSVLRYNSRVDEESEIKLNDVLDGDKERFLAMYDRIPYSGNGTRTGLALKHVRDKSLSVEYGNRPEVQDVVLVITDGKAQDPKDVKRIARELREEKGVLVYAVGIGLRDSVYKKLVKMTGDPSRAINADSFDDLLAGGLAETFGTTLCHDPCST